MWTCFGSVILSTAAGWSPRCEKRPAGPGKWGVLKVSAVTWDSYRPEENKALPTGVTPRPEHEVRAGDFLLSRANTAALVAKSVVVEDTPRQLMLSDKIVRLELSDLVSTEFFNVVNNSFLGRSYYESAATGTSQLNEERLPPADPFDAGGCTAA